MKRLITATLIVLMISTVFVTAISAATFSDIKDAEWAEGYITYLSDKKILDGYEDGTFKPNNVVKRSEFIKMMTETFGLTETKLIGYADVPSSEWYYSYIAKAAAQGFILEYGNTLNPEGEIKREEAAALLARYLGLTEMAEPSVYPDYSTISPQYRNYVLQTTKAGVFGGYPDGTFGAQDTLTRAEALTILYRAAGVIYSETASGVDAAAAPKNAIVTKGLTVYGATIDGTIYITEGTSGSKVTFENCTLNADVYVRGSAEVTFNNTTVKNLIVEPKDGKKAAVIVSGTSVITSMTALSPVDVSIASNARVTALTISANAAGSKVTGKGTLSSLNVAASGFTSEIVPAEYVISLGITAVINGIEYTNEGAAVTGTGFEGKYPMVSKAANSNITFTYKTKTEGTIYYAFTPKRNVTPTADVIKSGALSVSVGTAKEGTTTLPTAYTRLSDSDLVAVFYDASGNAYEPIRVFTSDDSGLLGATTVKGSSVGGVYTATYSISSQVPGKAYVLAYLRNETSSLTDAKIISYAQSKTAERGLVGDVIDMPKPGTTYTYEITIPSSYTTNNWDTAIIFVTENGTQQAATYSTISAFTETFTAKQPLQGNGFEVAPKLLPDDPMSIPATIYTKDTISYKTQGNGRVYYYYSNTSTAPTVAGFTDVWKNAPMSIASQFTVIGGTTGQQQLMDKAGNTYAYIVFSYMDESGNYYTPVIIGRAAALTSGSGFAATPAISISGSSEYLSCAPIASGWVYYVHTTSSTAPSIESFPIGVVGTGSYRVSGGGVAIALPAATAVYTHVAIIFVDDNGVKYQPVVVPRAGNTNTATTGITANVVTGVTDYDLVSGSTIKDGTVAYYYASSSESIPTIGNFTMKYAAASIKGTAVSTGGSVSSFMIQVNDSARASYNVIVMMFTDSSGIAYTVTALALPRT